MEYSVRVWSAIQGDVVPLRYVAEAMARCAASGYGTLPLHGPTLKNLRPERTLLLLDAARKGQLTVCNSQGHIGSAKELTDDLVGAEAVEAINAEDILTLLHAKRQHLIEWGKASGDIFLFVETPGTVVDSDLRNFTEAGFGKTIEAGYFRSAVGGGESEPWHDSLHSKAPASTAPAQSPAPPTPMDAVGALGGMELLSENKPKRNTATGPVFNMKRVAMIEQHKHEWPTIEGDMRDATINGLSVAKAGSRDWVETIALDWARAKGKLRSPVKPADSLVQVMHGLSSLPTTRHRLKG